MEVRFLSANTPDGSVVMGEFGANVTLRMLWPSQLPPNEVTEFGIVNDVI